uniref:DNA-directed RNA polymerase subunit n=1 Tax=Sinocyclocheilus grahami TaxID=75366 RepID=A0A672SLB4_SINGR
MANWTQEDGAAKPVASPADVSTAAQISSGNVAAVPCLIPSFADAVKLLNARYSCLVLDSHRRHISLSPEHLRKKRTGIREELAAELLKYSSSLKGVPVAYDDIKVVGQHGDIYDDQGFIHLNIEASFVVFKPKKGSKLVGVINKMGVGHVGCLVHGCFNASVVKPSLLSSEQWRDCGLCVGQSLEFEVFQLDADAAGVLLIRGRLEKCRYGQCFLFMFLTSNCYFRLKYESIIYNNASSSEKVVWSESGEKSAQIKHRENSPKQLETNMWETTGDGLFHWSKRYFGLWTHILVKNLIMIYLFLKNTQFLVSQDSN